MISFSRLGRAGVPRSFAWLWLLAVASLAPEVSATTLSPDYDQRPITTSGDLAALGTLPVPAGADLFVEGMAQSGLVTFSAAPTRGKPPTMLLQWTDNAVTPLVVPGGGRSPHWPLDVYWPQDVSVDRPVGVNRSGDVVFSVESASSPAASATYWWEAGTQTALPARLAGSPAWGSLLFTSPGGVAPALNNRDEIALIGQVRDSVGPLGYGLFFQEQVFGDGPALRPVLLPAGSLPVPNGALVPAETGAYFRPSIDDSGRIAFLAQLHGSTAYSAYVWEWGDTDSVMISGASLQRGVQVTDVGCVSLNNRDRSVLAAATTSRVPGSRYGLYRVLNGTVTAIIEPGRALPGGGTLQSVLFSPSDRSSPPLMGVSEANMGGQHAFLATLTDGSAALCRLDPDGTITSVLRTDPPPAPADPDQSVPDLTFTPGSRPCINDQGQIAVSLRRSDGESVLLLLTPA